MIDTNNCCGEALNGRGIDPTINEDAFERILTILKALSVETRLRLLLRLVGGERCVCELWPGLGEQSNISRHLKKLLDLGIVARRDEGARHLYRIADWRVIHLLSHTGILVGHRACEEAHPEAAD